MVRHRVINFRRRPHRVKVGVRFDIEFRSCRVYHRACGARRPARKRVRVGRVGSLRQVALAKYRHFVVVYVRAVFIFRLSARSAVRVVRHRVNVAVNEFDGCGLLVDGNGSRTGRQRGSVGYAINLNICEHVARLVYIVNRPCWCGSARPLYIGFALRRVIYCVRSAVLMRDGQDAVLGQMRHGNVEVFAHVCIKLILIA